MSVASLGFLIFLLVTFLVFYICPVRFRWIVLLIASVCFYVIAGSWKFLPFIIFTSLVIWLSALKIGSLNNELKEKLSDKSLEKSEKKELRARYKNKTKAILILALVLCVGILVVTKFARYAVEYLNRFTLSHSGVERFSIAWLIVPLGISYYTFSTVGYLLDIYWKRYEPEKNFARFFLYAIYFPHIVQGPISRYNLLGQELKKELTFDSRRVAFGMELMIYGFFKKLVVADRLAVFIASVYNGQNQPGVVFITAMIFDAVMIYADFSGYMDIVTGASQIFGVQLEQNFNHPFFARNVAEFWRRWHMTLGGWFKDYVYYPITVSSWMKKVNKSTAKALPARAGRVISVAIPCMITWFLTGLWHGTGKTYVCWGIYYGILITVSVAFEPEFQAVNKALKIDTESFWFRLFQHVRTFVIFMGGRVLTSPGALYKTKIVLKGIVFNLQPYKLFDNTLNTYGLSEKEMHLMYVCFIVIWGVSMLQERGSVREGLAKKNIVLRWAVIYAALFTVLVFGLYGVGYNAAAFVYAQF